MPTLILPGLEPEPLVGECLIDFIRNHEDWILSKGSGYLHISIPNEFQCLKFRYDGAGSEKMLPYIIPGDHNLNMPKASISGSSNVDSIKYSYKLVNNCEKYGFLVRENEVNLSYLYPTLVGPVRREFVVGDIQSEILGFTSDKFDSSIKETVLTDSSKAFNTYIQAYSKFLNAWADALDYYVSEPEYKQVLLMQTLSWARIRASQSTGYIFTPFLISEETYTLSSEKTRFTLSVTGPNFSGTNLIDIINAGGTNISMGIPEGKFNPFKDIYIECLEN